MHGLRQKGPCRARRDKPACPHGRPLWCNARHRADDRRLGTPLCADCYDHTGHVVWQWHAPELWRRFNIALQCSLPRHCGLTVTEFRQACKISYSKVVEFQARGIIHIHVPVRLDGPAGPDGPAPALPVTTSDLEAAIHATAQRVYVDAAPLADGTTYRLRWGSQVDTRTITDTADRDRRSTRTVHPEQVSSYLAKYLTKSTVEFGLPSQVKTSRHAALAGASDHALRIIETAEHLAAESDAYAKLLSHLGTLGHRGHPITKSRAYSVTFGQLRRARRHHRRNPAGLAPDADIRESLDDDPDLGPDLIPLRAAEDLGMRRASQQRSEPLPERLSTVLETSTFLGVPVSTLYHWHYRDEGPKPYKVGRHLRYDSRAVMRWLDDSAA